MYLFMYFFMFFGLISTLMIILCKNTIQAVLFLILLCCNVSGLLLLLNLDYLACVFLIVYVGAVAILFLFVIMMLNLRLMERLDNILRHVPGLFAIFLMIVSELFYIFNKYFIGSFFIDFSNFPFYINWIGMIDSIAYIKSVGHILYTYTFLPFLLSSFVLLLAMQGSILLTSNHLKKNRSSTSQQLFQQLDKSLEHSYFYPSYFPKRNSWNLKSFLDLATTQKLFYECCIKFNHLFLSFYNIACVPLLEKIPKYRVNNFNNIYFIK